MKEDCGQTNDLQPLFNMRNCKENMERNECACVCVQYNTSFDLTACYIICD